MHGDERVQDGDGVRAADGRCVSQGPDSSRRAGRWSHADSSADVVTYACWNFKACGLIGMTIARLTLMSKARGRGRRRRSAKGVSWRRPLAHAGAVDRGLGARGGTRDKARSGTGWLAGWLAAWRGYGVSCPACVPVSCLSCVLHVLRPGRPGSLSFLPHTKYQYNRVRGQMPARLHPPAGRPTRLCVWPSHRCCTFPRRTLSLPSPPRLLDFLSSFSTLLTLTLDFTPHSSLSVSYPFDCVPWNPHRPLDSPA